MPTTQKTAAKIPVRPGMRLRRTTIAAPGRADDPVNRVKPGEEIYLTDILEDGSAEGFFLKRLPGNEPDEFPYIHPEFLTWEFFTLSDQPRPH